MTKPFADRWYRTGGNLKGLSHADPRTVGYEIRPAKANPGSSVVMKDGKVIDIAPSEDVAIKWVEREKYTRGKPM